MPLLLRSRCRLGAASSTASAAVATANHAVHVVAICQIRSEGRVYFEKRVAEGKTKREATGRSSVTSATPSIGNSSSTRN